MQVISLFSGIGGFDLAAKWLGWHTVAFCEIDPHCRKVLAKHWPGVYIHHDIHTLDYDTLIQQTNWQPTQPTILVGGFPCQPFSVAGKRRGKADDRHLWPQMARLVAELRPRHVLAENVPGLIKLGLDQVLADLAATGYAAQACGVPACAVGAAHIRQRIWIYAADTNGTRWGQLHATTQPIGAGQHTGLDAQASGHTDWWAAESSFCGVPDGLSTGVDSGRRQRLKQLGNAIVPQVAYELLRYVQAVDTLHYSNSKPKTNRYERTPKSTLPLVRRQVEGRP